MYLPAINHTGAQSSNNSVVSSLRTQWYTKFSACVQFWIFPRKSHFFLSAADFHSIALEGQRDTMETVGIDSGHIDDAKD